MNKDIIDNFSKQSKFQSDYSEMNKIIQNNRDNYSRQWKTAGERYFDVDQSIANSYYYYCYMQIVIKHIRYEIQHLKLKQ